MPHGARKLSASGYYHVVPKGINSQILFEDDADRLLYIRLMKEAQRDTGILIHAYCLMSNHVHLVLQDPHQQLSSFIKTVHEQYGTAYSKKYGRVGGVFAKTCWSEPIESDAYLLCAVRYVHANPANAGICMASEYEWSSAKDYLGRKGITETSTILGMCGGVQGFIKFSQADNGTFLPFPGSKLTHHINDEEACVIARHILGYDPRALGLKDGEERDKGIALLRNRGFPDRVTVRITGIGKYIVAHAA